MRYEKTITINKATADAINRYLTVEPTCAKECFNEDDTIIYTAVFHDGIEVDIKCCGVQYREDEESNTAWCEAVMFKNGHEVDCWYGEDDFFGEWWMEYDNDDYVVIVEVDQFHERKSLMENMEKFKQMFSEYCRSEIAAGHCDEYDCQWCAVNMAWDKIFCAEPEDEE